MPVEVAPGVRELLVRLRDAADTAPSSEAAVHLLESVAREMTGLLGRHDRDSLTAWRELGYHRNRAGDPVGAVHLLGQVTADLAHVFGPADPDTLYAGLELATAVGDSGDPNGAAHRLRELLPALTAAAGPDDARTLAAHVRLAVETGRLGDVMGAIGAFALLIPRIQQVLGEGHPLLGEARCGLGRLVPHRRRLAGGGGIAPVEAVAMVHRLMVWDFDTDEEADAFLSELEHATGQRHLAGRLATVPDTLTPDHATAIVLGAPPS
ncbi:hypothetical protein [Kitasatospora camelliae]|uniref:Tetratricopeptide repeat protein n=1 Tax=Kitasatospora camelliae TaxID=3156397 RepID=A0AAU8JYB5_9ACTN